MLIMSLLLDKVLLRRVLVGLPPRRLHLILQDPPAFEHLRPGGVLSLVQDPLRPKRLLLCSDFKATTCLQHLRRP